MNRVMDRRAALFGIGTTALMAPGKAHAMSTLIAGSAEQAAWWKKATIYQIYPRSFMDSNGDGVGDLLGITSRLDYLKMLGLDAVWLSPHFDSPNADNGYDIRDYRKVMPQFGTMDDFDAMLAGMKERNIRLILDLVVNHTSDEHQWFVESRKSRDNPFRDFYIWRDGKADGPPNNYPSLFGGSAWTKDEETGQWYLHYFAEKQPDLNWDNPVVREEVYKIMRFWLEKGVSGFRMDVIPLISKPPGLPDLTPAQLAEDPALVYASGPNVHRYIGEMHARVLEPYDAVAIGEATGVTLEALPNFIDDRRKELSLAFHFDIIRIGRQGWRQTDWTLPEWKALFAHLDQATGAHMWKCIFLENHDHPRSVSKFGDKDPVWRERSAKVLAMLLLTQRGTPFIYQGQEIGMTNYPFYAIADYDDVQAKGYWDAYVETGTVTEKTFLAHLAETSRDNSRTPMQWTADSGAGFTKGRPWLAINPNHDAINVAVQSGKPGSTLECYRDLIRFRRQTADLYDGAYLDLAPADPGLFVYCRGKMVVALNFTRKPRTFTLPEGGNVRFVTSPGGVALDGPILSLKGWEGAIIEASA